VPQPNTLPWAPTTQGIAVKRVTDIVLTNASERLNKLVNVAAYGTPATLGRNADLVQLKSYPKVFFLFTESFIINIL
jgi:hypothetical protein